MQFRFAKEGDYLQLARMKWLHCEEDDADYQERNLEGVNEEQFLSEFVRFLQEHREYKIFVAEDKDVLTCAMFVYLIPKTPRPNTTVKYIAYLTNVYTRKEYRNQAIGTQLLSHIKAYLAGIACELIFAWPSDNSVNWYRRNGFYQENEVFEYDIQ